MPTIPLQFNLENRSSFDRIDERSTDATLPELEIQLLNGSTPVDLTGATVKFTMKDEADVAKVNDAAAVLVDGLTGKVKYVWSGTDLDTKGRYTGQFAITVSSEVYKIPNNESQKLFIIIADEVAP